MLYKLFGLYFTFLTHPRRCLLSTNAYLAAIGAFTMAICSAASAQTRLVDGDIQLRGAQSNHTIPIVVAAGTKPQTVQLKLLWSASSLIEPRRSVLNVVVNGQIQSSRRLSDMGQNTWTLKLRPLPAGQYDLAVQVYLRGKDDDCIPLPESLWFTLQDTSTIEGASRRTLTGLNPGIAVRDFPKNWRSEAVGTSTQAAASKGKLQLSHDFPWDGALAAALLQTQLLLSNQGLEPYIDSETSDKDSSARRLRIRSLDKLPTQHPARARWSMSKETQFVLYAPSTSQLELIARTPLGVQLAMELLNDTKRRSLCHENLCSSSVTDNDQGHRTLPMAQAQASDSLWRMLDGDQPRGWTASGAGTHKLRQVWLRPVTFELESDVQMHLAARVSQASQIDSTQSSLSLKINDQPIATYSLADWKAGHAKALIPASLWRARAWVMDFEVRLIPRSAQRCSYLIQDDFWVTLDPETRIEAKFKQQETDGISGFWQRRVSRPTLQVLWNGANALPSALEISQFIPVLRAFAQAEPQAGPRWVFVDPSVCQRDACIVMHPTGTDQGKNGGILAWRAALGRVPDQAKGLPDFNIGGTALIAWQAREGNAAERLHIVLGAPSGQLLGVPELSGFAGPIAVHTDQWQFFASQTALAESAAGAVSQKAGNVSQQQGRLRWINLIWALTSLVFITALAMTYWRKKRKANNKTWEVD